MAEYGGVDVDHPSIVNAIHNMTARGESVEKIMRVVGVPAEVVEKHKRTAPKEK